MITTLSLSSKSAHMYVNVLLYTIYYTTYVIHISFVFTLLLQIESIGFRCWIAQFFGKVQSSFIKCINCYLLIIM